MTDDEGSKLEKNKWLPGTGSNRRHGDSAFTVPHPGTAVSGHSLSIRLKRSLNDQYEVGSINDAVGIHITVHKL